MLELPAAAGATNILKNLKSGHLLKTAAAQLQNHRNSCADLADSADLLDQAIV
jgi:hypothetical protein